MYSYPKPRARSLQAGIQLYTNPLLLAGAFDQLECLAEQRKSAATKTLLAGPGCVVDVLDLNDGSQASLVLVMPNEAAPDKLRISVLSPLGSSLLGLKKGDASNLKLWGRRHKFQVMDVRYSDSEVNSTTHSVTTRKEVTPL